MSKLNLGCGGARTEGYINVDVAGDAADVKMGMRDYVRTCTDSSVEAIIMSHSLEHIIYQEAESLLKECYRIMAPGGRLEIVCPNFIYAMKKYLAGQFSRQECQTFMQGNQRDKYDRHCWVTDEATLPELIKNAGFKVDGIYAKDANVAVHAHKE